MRLSRPTLLGIAVIAVFVLGGAAAAFAQDNSSSSSSYTVKTGDILDSIAATYDVQTACLAKANNLDDPSKIKPGQTLTIDLSCPKYDGFDIVTNPREGASTASASNSDLGQGGGGGAPSSTATTSDQSSGTSTPTSYTVARGDTLDTIGQKLNVSVVSLQIANSIGPRDKITPGQTLTIPQGAPAYGMFPALSNPQNPSTSTIAASNSDLGQGGGGGAPSGAGDQSYVVQPRDTLDQIGARYDMQTSCLATNNNLGTPNVIYPGETIVLSASCPKYDGFDTVTNPRSS